MTQSLKSSPHKSEDLGSDPQFPHKTPGMAACASNSSTGEEEARGPLELSGQPTELSQ